MTRRVLRALQRAADAVSAQPPARLVLAMTALVLVLRPAPTNLAAKLLLPMIGGALLLFPGLLSKPLPWLLALASTATTTWLFWFQLDNHQYLITYWCVVCALAVQAEDTEEVLRWNARKLIGLCFFFAVLTKLAWGDYLDGSFFRFQLLTDPRLEHAAMLLGGVPGDDLERHRAIVRLLLVSPPDAEAALVSTPRLHAISLAVSAFVLAVESAIALAFLVSRPRRLGGLRDALLLVFFVTTYPFAPVPGFASILAVMGLAQCPADRPKTRLAYVAFFVLIPLVVVLPTHLHRLPAFLLGQP